MVHLQMCKEQMYIQINKGGTNGYFKTGNFRCCSRGAFGFY